MAKILERTGLSNVRPFYDESDVCIVCVVIYVHINDCCSDVHKRNIVLFLIHFYAKYRGLIILCIILHQ